MSEWRPKEPPSPTIVEQKAKQHMNLDPILNQGVNIENIYQFLNNQEERVLAPAKDILAEDILEEFAADDIPKELGDNFVPNQADEPSESDWDTTPTASAIKFFRGMADEERRRRGLFRDD